MIITIPKPNPKQERFLLDKHRHVGFGGARGGGKSWAIRTKADLLANRYHGIRICIVRRTYPELEENHIVPLKKQLFGRATYNKQEKKFTFKNGSTIKFQYCKNDGDLDNFQGVEFDIIFIDEATQFTEYQLKCIAASCRGTNNFPKRVYYTCNPGGPGHGYIKRIFIDRRYQDNENPDDYSFTQALVQDNKVLMEMDPEYIKNLEALPPKLRRAWLEGDWDIFEGQFFEDFIDDPEHYQDRKWTNVIEPFEIPEGWKIYRSYDYGYAKPFSVGWWAVDYDGVLYRIMEMYGCTGEPNVGVKWTADKQAKEIRRIETTHPWLKGKKIYGPADPAIWEAQADGISIQEVMTRNGVIFQRGANARIPGWQQVHYRLAFDENGYSMFYVFNNCKNFIRTIPLLMYDEHKAEDLDTELEDHIADETRYMCMARPITPRKPVVSKPLLADPLNMGVNSTGLRIKL